MPALLTHHLFGRAMLAKNDNRSFTTRDSRDAFLLGNQGPDPLFFTTRSLALVRAKKLGSALHSSRIEEYLKHWREILNRVLVGSQEHDILHAYLSGFLCHYALDRTAHPLIYAYEQALCNAGVTGLEPQDGTYVHGQIEADLDVYLLYKLTGRTIDEYCIPKQVLYASDTTLGIINTLYRTAARLYGIKVSEGCFAQSVKDMRAVIKLLYSPGGTKRKLIGTLERLVSPHSLLQAISHRPEAAYSAHSIWYANERHERWAHPRTGRESTSSFKELFEQALVSAAHDCVLFDTGAPLSEISQGLNFSGNARPDGPGGIRSHGTQQSSAQQSGTRLEGGR